MKKYILTILLLPLLYAGETNATHIIGGELTYECIDPTFHIYRIRMKLYRDCTPGVPHAGFDSVVYVGVYHADSFLHNPPLPVGVDIPFPQNYITLENTTYDLCLFAPPNVCVEEAIYERIVTLPPRPGGYLLLYQRCCRNGSIVNITNPLGTGAHWAAQIPDTGISSCNTSASYKLYPPTVICANKPIDFDHSAVDPDGDSLVYRLCRAYDGAFGALNAAPPPPPKFPAFGTVDYITPTYNWDNPLGGSDTLKIDRVTGQLSGMAQTVGQFVVAICVDEYRDGNLLTMNRRDFQFNVVQCDSIIYPNFTASIEPCASDYSVEFAYTGKNGGIFYWDFGDAGGADTSTLMNPVYVFSDTGTYTVTLTVNPGSSCDTTMTKTIHVPDWKLNADFSFITACEGEPVDFTDLSTTNQGLVITNWQWNFGDGTSSSDQNPSHTYFDGQARTVLLVITTDDGCIDSIAKGITFQPAPLVTASANVTQIQLGDAVTLSAIGSGGTPPYTYSWSPMTTPATGTPVSASPTVKTTYVVTIEDAIGCKNTDDVEILLLSDIAVEVPTAFTPNQDGLNDFFKVYDQLGTAEQGIGELQFNVYNRWGELVFQATSIEGAFRDGWDGTHMNNGKELEIGVYAWMLKVTKKDGEEIEPLFGNVSLLR
jgi:gliding motility-associated-like protein